MFGIKEKNTFCFTYAFKKMMKGWIYLVGAEQVWLAEEIKRIAL